MFDKVKFEKKYMKLISKLYFKQKIVLDIERCIQY